MSTPDRPVDDDPERRDGHGEDTPSLDEILTRLEERYPGRLGPYRTLEAGRGGTCEDAGAAR